MIPKPKRQKKKKLPTLAKVKKDLQVVVNRYIRQRDSKDGWFTCISCGKAKTVDHLQCGHFIAVSKSQYLRFNEWNCNGECDSCNLFDENHLIWYQDNLIRKIGTDAVQYLKRTAQEVKLYKHSREELETIKQYYLSLTKEGK